MVASRSDSVPEDFLQQLKDSVEGFAAETVDHQFHLARMAWVGLYKANEHSYFDDAMTFTAVDLEEMFGRGQFNKINSRLNFFNKTANWSHRKGHTRGYWFSHHVRLAVDAYLARPRDEKLKRLVTKDGRAVLSVPRAVDAKDKRGVTTTAWKRANALHLVQVNLGELDRLRDQLAGPLSKFRAEEVESFHPEPDLAAAMDRCVVMIDKIQILARTKAAGFGVVAHRYQEADSGRLYPNGISLASTQSIIKNAALIGRWEYDVSNCHFSIVVQMATAVGFECAAISHYLRNKKAVRAEISSAAAITEDQVKMCLLALLYGARLSPSPKTAISREIGRRAAVRLFSTTAFRAIADEVGAARHKVLETSERTSRGWVMNAFGKTIAGESNASQLFAHLLQGAEAKALQAVINAYPDEVILVQHDGFVSKSRLDLVALAEAVRTATGFSLSYEEKQLSPDALAYFKDR